VGFGGRYGFVTLETTVLDAAKRRALVTELGREAHPLAGIEVLNASGADFKAVIDDYEAQVGAADLITFCGPIRFSEVPPDLAEFDGTEDAAAEIVVLFSGLSKPHTFQLAARTPVDALVIGWPTSRTRDRGEPIYLAVQREGDRWDPGSSGECRFTTTVPGYNATDIVLDSRPDPSSTQIELMIRERECANGRVPPADAIVPIVEESDARVVITVVVTPVQGGANCPGNPWHPITVNLDSPVGDRTVEAYQGVGLDPLRWPPTHPDLD